MYTLSSGLVTHLFEAHGVSEPQGKMMADAGGNKVPDRFSVGRKCPGPDVKCQGRVWQRRNHILRYLTTTHGLSDTKAVELVDGTFDEKPGAIGRS